MLIVTTPNIEGYRITRYIGLVTGEAILGANIFRDFFAGVRDVVGGRSTAYEKELRKAKQIAIDEMIAEARDHGATAVVSLDLDYATLTSSSGNMMMVSANGTAVVLEEIISTAE